MRDYETREPEELSDDKRCLLIGEDVWIYRQPGGCIELGKRDDADGAPAADLIHMCEADEVDAVIVGLQAVRDRVPARF